MTSLQYGFYNEFINFKKSVRDYSGEELKTIALLNSKSDNHLIAIYCKDILGFYLTDDEKFNGF